MMRSDLAVNDPSGVNRVSEKSGKAVMSVPEKSDGRPLVVEARCVRLAAKADAPALVAPAAAVLLWSISSQSFPIIVNAW